MEFAIVLILVFIVWTNEAILGRALLRKPPRKTAEEKFADALQEFLQDGFKVRAQVEVSGSSGKKIITTSEEISPGAFAEFRRDIPNTNIRTSDYQNPTTGVQRVKGWFSNKTRRIISYNRSFDSNQESSGEMAESRIIQEEFIGKNQIFTRYSEIQCSQPLMLGKKFDLNVQLLTGQNSSASSEPYIFEEEPFFPDYVMPEVIVVLRANNFTIEGSRVKKMRLTPNLVTEASFLLIPQEYGSQEIEISFYQYDRLIGSFFHDLEVLNP